MKRCTKMLGNLTKLYGGKMINQMENEIILLHVFFPSLNNDVLNYLDERTFQTFENAVHSDKPDRYDCVFLMKN